MKQIGILEFIKNSNNPVTAAILSEVFGIAKSNIRKRLKIHLDDGDISMTIIDHTYFYSSTEKDYREKAQPRTYDFKPLRHHPSRLANRFDGNDQYKSKYN